MVTVRKSKLLTPTSVIPENTYYYEFDCDTIAELPTATYQGTNVAHGSLATIIANGRQYRINGEGEWCIQRYDASDPILIEKTITENGTYSAVDDDDADGYSSVTANVPNTYTESDEGKVVDNGELVAQTARAESITANGTYDTTMNNSVTVDVPVTPRGSFTRQISGSNIAFIGYYPDDPSTIICSVGLKPIATLVVLGSVTT